MHEQDMAVPEGPRSGLDRPSGRSFSELPAEMQTQIYDEFVSRFPDPVAGAVAWETAWVGPSLDRSQGTAAEAADLHGTEDAGCGCPRGDGLVEVDEDDDTDLIENTLADVADELGWEL